MYSTRPQNRLLSLGKLRKKEDFCKKYIEQNCAYTKGHSEKSFRRKLKKKNLNWTTVCMSFLRS